MVTVNVASFLISGSVKLAPGATVPGGQASGWVMALEPWGAGVCGEGSTARHLHGALGTGGASEPAELRSCDWNAASGPSLGGKGGRMVAPSPPLLSACPILEVPLATPSVIGNCWHRSTAGFQRSATRKANTLTGRVQVLGSEVARASPWRDCPVDSGSPRTITRWPRRGRQRVRVSEGVRGARERGGELSE